MRQSTTPLVQKGTTVNIELSDGMTVHRADDAGQPICGAGSVSSRPFHKTRKHVTCRRCRGIVKDMDAKAVTKMVEKIAAEELPKAVLTPAAQELLNEVRIDEALKATASVDEVTEVGSFMVTFEYGGQKIVVENIKADDWQTAIDLATDMLIATAARTQYWIAQPKRV